MRLKGQARRRFSTVSPKGRWQHAYEAGADSGRVRRPIARVQRGSQALSVDRSRIFPVSTRMVAVGDREAASALAGQSLCDLLPARGGGCVRRADRRHQQRDQDRCRHGGQRPGRESSSSVHPCQSPPGAGSAAMVSFARPNAAAIAARSRTFGHITITVPIVIMRPPAQSQKTSGVRKTSNVARPL